MMSEVDQLLGDMNERLAYVLKTKESAVQQTLTDTETSLGLVGELKALMQMLSEGGSSQTASLGIDFSGKANELLNALQSHLVNVLTTQGYQDLTGQVLKRVMEDIHSLAGRDLSEQGQASEKRTDAIGHGPAALGREKEERAASQDDVDDLLNDLGI